ncbi:hypothetical protein NMY3_00283 [Candidatus Nitrosocosmicus oleophilus]|uniref:Uncharacterized protein n=1 Tax=Candidatus Nitrosocosmicus oleophilus TaxID=1353260 RepID=A0A654LU22_9ARCH|nr:hypothetical protein NMY3_00283 [Candidatus Nitrosocosmicus oleophilus]
MIQSLVSGILKVCLGDNNQPPTTPNPETTKFPTNYIEFGADSLIQDTQVNIVVSDSTSQYSNTYELNFDGQDPADVSDQFVIPIGDPYTVDVIFPAGLELPPVSFAGSDCQQTSTYTCSGTMGNTIQSISILISNPSSS